MSPEAWFRVQAELAKKNGSSNGVFKNAQGFILSAEAVKKYREEIKIPGSLKEWRAVLGGKVSVYSVGGKSTYGLKVPFKNEAEPDIKPLTEQEKYEIRVKNSKKKKKTPQVLSPPEEATT